MSLAVLAGGRSSSAIFSKRTWPESASIRMAELALTSGGEFAGWGASFAAAEPQANARVKNDNVKTRPDKLRNRALMALLLIDLAARNFAVQPDAYSTTARRAMFLWQSAGAFAFMPQNPPCRDRRVQCRRLIYQESDARGPNLASYI